jgi:hypothetical protein
VISGRKPFFRRVLHQWTNDFRRNNRSLIDSSSISCWFPEELPFTLWIPNPQDCYSRHNYLSFNKNSSSILW